MKTTFLPGSALHCGDVNLHVGPEWMLDPCVPGEEGVLQQLPGPVDGELDLLGRTEEEDCDDCPADDFLARVGGDDDVSVLVQVPQHLRDAWIVVMLVGQSSSHVVLWLALG